jgi:hypothetical protein
MDKHFLTCSELPLEHLLNRIGYFLSSRILSNFRIKSRDNLP